VVISWGRLVSPGERERSANDTVLVTPEETEVILGEDGVNGRCSTMLLGIRIMTQRIYNSNTVQEKGSQTKTEANDPVGGQELGKAVTLYNLAFFLTLTYQLSAVPWTVPSRQVTLQRFWKTDSWYGHDVQRPYSGPALQSYFAPSVIANHQLCRFHRIYARRT
jgi:hypothetical protein